MSKKYRSLIGLKLRGKILDYVRIAYYQTGLIICDRCEQAYCDKETAIFFYKYRKLSRNTHIAIALAAFLQLCKLGYSVCPP